MAKTLSYRLFGLGKIPEPLRRTLDGEGLLLMDEGIPGSVTYVDFRSPGRASSWRRQWFGGAIALTRVRLFALQYARTIIDVPLADERIRGMRFLVEAGTTLLVALDAGLFHADWSGQIEYRFRTEQASAFLEKLGRTGVTK
jgi:hypothetical protein